MLNRRSIRIKAMQTLFALEQCRKANLNIAREQIRETFMPDLNSMEPQDPAKLKAEAEEALRLFNSSYAVGKLDSAPDTPADSLSASRAALDFYYKKNDNDYVFFRKHMIDQAEMIFDLCVEILLFNVEFGKLAEADFEKRSNNTLVQAQPVGKGALNLSRNRVLNELAERLRKRTGGLDNDQRDNAEIWFKTILRRDPVYKDYLQNEAPTFEDDKQILLHIIKQILFKNEQVLAYMESKDINWAENRAIVRSMASKSVKLVTEDNLGDAELAELSMNWEEDRAFFELIFDLVVKNEREIENLVSEKAQNWSKERITDLDLVILKMAIAELMNFPSIPVKVTINEYVELAKNYSTPKSKKFVNGILDVAAETLQSKGKIKKSGRGLLDNK
ncbi:hypothetical protein FUAX_29050 [Fulvitalea axinellae]|uniref:Transcription antitermination protein NusB n=1 Tax=Fulvitalea axinellae TaxID=1182444 RepID=A0AAU9CQV3_9BACT|nr:hypothetical protein FUAX_29050 [Fulvitalea axinellae]